MRSKSVDGYLQTKDPYEDCIMSAKTFPPDSNHLSTIELPRANANEKEKERQYDEECRANDETDEATVLISQSYSDLSTRTVESWQQIGLGNHAATISDADNPLLFLHLYEKDWASALKRISEHPDEASVWIWRKARGYLLWRLLPLHASILLGAPSFLVLEILNAFPNAARKRDMNGSLPVHLAASRIDSHPDGERILNHLLRAFPDSAGIEDGNGRTAIEIAKVKGVSIDPCLSIEPEEDFMLGSQQAKTPRKTGGDIFTIQSGYATFESEKNQFYSIEDDLNCLKSGYIRITFKD